MFGAYIYLILINYEKDIDDFDRIFGDLRS